MFAEKNLKVPVRRRIMKVFPKNRVMGFLSILFIMLPSYAFGADTLNAGDTAWMLTATALVLFMTIPGLSLFYAGMVRSKNVLSVLMQCFAITGLMTVLWTLYAYSLAFENGGVMNQFIGSLDKIFLSGVGPESIREVG